MSRRGHLEAIRAITSLSRRYDVIAQFGSTSPQEALEVATLGLASDDAELREIAAGLLDVVGVAEPTLADSTIALLLPRLAAEDDPDALAAAIRVLGRLHAEAAEAGVIAHAQHEDASVRCEVAIALPSFTYTDAAITALCRLTADRDEVTRGHAVAGLSRSGLDDAEVCDAFAARAADPSREVRTAAIIALLERGDERAGAMVAAELADPHHDPIMERARDRLGVHGIHVPEPIRIGIPAEAGDSEGGRTFVGKVLAAALVVTLAIAVWAVATQAGAGR